MKSTEKQEKTVRSLEMELQELENARLCKVCLIGLQQTLAFGDQKHALRTPQNICSEKQYSH